MNCLILKGRKDAQLLRESRHESRLVYVAPVLARATSCTQSTHIEQYDLFSYFNGIMCYVRRLGHFQVINMMNIGLLVRN